MFKRMTLCLLLLAGIAQADDTELFVKSLPSTNRSNVLIVTDTSGSMSIKHNGRTRLDITKGAINKFLTDTNNINISLMSFNTRSWQECVYWFLGCWKYVTRFDSQGGNINFASENIATGRQGAINVVNSFSAFGGTPLTEALYEAYRYFSGSHPIFGSGSVSASKNGSNYKSPIVSQCQKSYIVLFTDGAPYLDVDANNDVRNLIQSKGLPGGLHNFCNGEGDCLDELAWYIRNHDVRPSIPGNQYITTYTIGGFGSAPPALLTSTANHGGGKYYAANDSSQLSAALSDILLRVNATNATFAAPATSTSAFNSFETAEDVYYIVFKPAVGPGWKGNLKRYRLGNDNKIYDANGHLAVDPATGFFSDTAKSFWSRAVDGKKVEAGGMAEQLTQGRPVFTSVTGDTNVRLSSLGNRLHESNSNITSAMLGTASAAETSSVLQWARGVDIDDQDSDGSTRDNRTSIGDPMHTQPQVVTYFKNSSGSVVDKTVFFTTNDGFLHAVNADNGTTEFSYIPEELLDNLKIYRDGFVSGGAKKVYGMDGPMTVWINDANNDGDILSSNNGASDSGDHVYLYLSMRRGGNNIYALNVTDRRNPELLWVIRGDIDNDHRSDAIGDFGRLGQTWSTPRLARVNWNGSQRQVLIFGGGYDLAIDGHSTIQNSNIGNAIFIVDAVTGNMLWRASNNNSNLNIPDMVYSIPAELTPIDTDQDGAVDMIFGADTGGQIFRIDINQNNTGASNFARGGVVAKLAGASAADARRFFEPVAVAMGKDGQYLNLAVGSGFRPSPLSKGVNDRVYVIQDPYIAQPPANYRYTPSGAYKESDLYDASNNLVQDGSSAQQAAALSSLNNAKGWFMNLESSGEKVLGRAVIYNGILLINSFAPISSASASCSPGSGVNFLYAVNIENGGAVFNFDKASSGLTKSDRKFVLKHGALAPEASIVSRGAQGGEICVGTECLQNVLRGVNPIPVIRRFWRENR